MNLIQAMEVLNEHRPEKPRSLGNRKLQEAIDTLNEYADATPDGFKHRCIECKHCKFINGKGKPYGTGTQIVCSLYELMDISNNSISAGLCFIPKEDNNETDQMR